MAKITTSWTKIKEAYCGWDGYHDVYWRMYARISAQTASNTTVSVEGRIYVSGNAGSFSSWATTTCGGNVGNYSSWGEDAEGTYYVGETTVWRGSDTTTGTSISAGTRFYSSPWGWTGENLYLSDTLTFDPATSPPTGLTVSLSEVYTDGAKFNVSISGYGIPNDASGRYIEAAILGQSVYGGPYKYDIAYRVTSSAITVTNASTRGTLTIRPNTQYYYGAYATNTQKYVSKVQGQFVTKAEAPTVALISTTADSAVFSYSVPADGGHYNRVIQYSINNGTTWRDGATVTGGTAKTGTFAVNGLLAGTTYNMLIRVSTQVGTTDGESVSFDTLVGEEDNRNIFYGSVNGKAREVQVLYGGVNDEAKPINKLYGAVSDIDYFRGLIRRLSQHSSIQGFDAAQFKTKMMASPIWPQRTSFGYLRLVGIPGVVQQGQRLYRLEMHYKNGGQMELGYGIPSVIDDFGIIFVNPIPSPVYETIDDVVLSPGIVTKLTHQGFGHIDYS